MADPLYFARARREAKRARAPQDPEHRGPVAPISFEVAKARRALRNAEFAVEQMQAQLNANCPGRIDFAMVRKIGAAERRVAQAREILRRIEPNTAD